MPEAGINVSYTEWESDEGKQNNCRSEILHTGMVEEIAKMSTELPRFPSTEETQRFQTTEP